MPLLARKNVPILIESGAAALAAAAVVVFSLLPRVRLIGLFAVLLAGLLFCVSRYVGGPMARPRWHPALQGRCWLPTPLDLPILLILLQVGVSFRAGARVETTSVAACQLGAGLVAYYAVVNWARDRTRLWWTAGALILVGTGLALISPFTVDWFRNVKTFLPSRLFALFPLLVGDSVHPNVMAGALITMIPLPLALLLSPPALSQQRPWLRAALLAVCLVQVAVVALTKSRGGYLALGVGVWLTLWLSGRRRWAIGLAVLAILLVACLVVLSPGNGGERPTAAQAALDAGTWAFRQRIWQTAIRIIRDFPLTGAGMGAFNDVADLLYEFRVPRNPGAHSVFLQVATDLGLPGLVGFLAILLLVLWAGLMARSLLGHFQERSLRAVAIGGLSSMVATIAHGLVDSHTWGSKGAFLPWTVMGLVVASYMWALSRRPGPA